MSSTNTALNCLFCFNNISFNDYYQQQNQNYLTPSDIISCCSKHLSKEFIDSIDWKNIYSTAGNICQECYNIAEKINNLNTNLDKTFEEINELGARLNIRISKGRGNHKLSTQKSKEIDHREDNNQVSDLLYPAASTKLNDPDWKYYKVQELQDNDQIQKDDTSSRNNGSFNSVDDNFDDVRDWSFFEASNYDADNGEKCRLSQAKPIKMNDKRGSFAKKKEITVSNHSVKAVSEREVITGSELQRHINNGLDSGFKCDKCSKIFQKMVSLRRHDCSTATYECEICKKSLSAASGLKTHMRIHSGEKPYKCDTCGKCFALRSTLKLHIHSHSDERPMKCKCGKSFRYKSGLNTHLAIHENSRLTKYKCDICFNFFGSLSILKHHFLTHLKNKTQKCKLSRKPFTHGNHTGFATKAITDIEPIQTDSVIVPFLCVECGQVFDTASSLLKHIGLHHGEKILFKCETCEKILYLNSSQLKLHSNRCHNGMHLQCDKTFQSKQFLQKHFTSLNCTITGTQQQMVKSLFPCGICEKSFESASGRRQHKIKHLPVNQRPSFDCEVCDKTFQYKGHMKVHHKIHHLDLPFVINKGNFPCKRCKGNFKFKIQYTEHRNKLFGESVIQCQHCTETFSSLCECTIHRDQAHPIEMSKLDYGKCNTLMEHATFFNGEWLIIQEIHNEEENPESCNTGTPLTRMPNGVGDLNAENSKEFESFNDEEDKSENEFGSHSFSDGSGCNVQVESEVYFKDTEIKIEYSVA